MPPLPRRPVSAGARAPAEHGSYQEARKGKISQVRVSTLSGEPRHASLVWRPAARCVAPLARRQGRAGSAGVLLPGLVRAVERRPCLPDRLGAGGGTVVAR